MDRQSLDITEQAGAESGRVIDGRSGVAVAIILLFANMANYGFQIVTGRLLSVEEYGLLAGFMSAITIITVSTSALQTTAARSIAARQNRPDKHGLLDDLTRTAVVVGAGCGAVIAVTAPITSKFLNIGLLPILFLGVYVIPSALDSIAAGRLQGSQRFKALALYSAGQAVAKLGVAAGLIAIGLRVTGLVGGLVISSCAIAMWGLMSSRGLGAIETHVLDPEVRRGFMAFLLLWVILSADIAFARAFFEPEEAGIYAAAAVLGKAVLWVPTVVTQLLFPHLADRSARGQRVAGVMGRAVVIVLGLSITTTAGLYFFGRRAFALLYGDRYAGASDIAWKIGLAMVPAALVNLLLFHFLARRQGRFLRWMGLAAVAEVLALYLGPKSGTAYAIIVGGIGALLLLALVPRMAWRHLSPSSRAKA